MAKYRSKGYSNYFWDGRQDEAVDRLRDIAKDLGDTDEGDDLADAAQELDELLSRIEDTLYDLDESDEE